MEHCHQAALAILRQKNRKDRRLLSDFSCLAGWKHRHRNNCLQDENHEETHQLVNSQHGHVRSAVFDFRDSSGYSMALHKLLADRWSSWPGLMQAGFLLIKCLHICVYSEPGSDSSGSFGSCSISPPFSAHQFKAVPFFYSHHMDHRDGFLLPISLGRQTFLISWRVGVQAALERSLRRILIL